MTLLVPRVDGIPAPVPSLHAGPYWEGCRRGELLFLQCAHCQAIPPLPTLRCPRCHGDELAWQPSNGIATLYSWTVVWRPQHPAFRVPYAPAIVDLEEGYRLLTAIVGCEPDALSEGLAMEVEFHAVNEEITLPFFRPR